MEPETRGEPAREWALADSRGPKGTSGNGLDSRSLLKHSFKSENQLNVLNFLAMEIKQLHYFRYEDSSYSLVFIYDIFLEEMYIKQQYSK